MAAEHTLRLGNRIKEFREAKGLSQRELAALLPGKSDGTQVSKWERGQHRPSDDTLEHIARALDRSIADFLLDGPPDGEDTDLIGTLDEDRSAIGGRLAAIEQQLQDSRQQQSETNRLLRELLEQRERDRDYAGPEGIFREDDEDEEPPEDERGTA